MRIPSLLPWIALPVLVGAVLAATVDTTSLPLVGQERIEAVFLVDGQAYFGHLDDTALSGTLVMRDVFYLDDAKGRGTDYDANLVHRGVEVHQPADGMRVRREHVLVIERVGLDSPVGRAIAAQRGLERLEGK